LDTPATPVLPSPQGSDAQPPPYPRQILPPTNSNTFDTVSLAFSSPTVPTCLPCVFTAFFSLCSLFSLPSAFLLLGLSFYSACALCLNTGNFSPPARIRLTIASRPPEGSISFRASAAHAKPRPVITQSSTFRHWSTHQQSASSLHNPETLKFGTPQASRYRLTVQTT
ncbi:hypothetical protein C8F04DRAFT_1068354, partial [Mycena alexandri]